MLRTWPHLPLSTLTNRLCWISKTFDQRLIYSLHDRSVEPIYNKASIRPEDAHCELVHQIWAQPDQPFVCKWAETTRPIRRQKTEGIQRSITTSQSGHRRPVMSLLSDFERNPQQFIRNMRKLLDQLEARKRQESNKSWPKFNRAWGVPY